MSLKSRKFRDSDGKLLDTTAILKNSWHQSQGHNVIFSQKSKHEHISITYVEINSVYFNLGRDQLFYIRYNDIIRF